MTTEITFIENGLIFPCPPGSNMEVDMSQPGWLVREVGSDDWKLLHELSTETLNRMADGIKGYRSTSSMAEIVSMAVYVLLSERHNEAVKAKNEQRSVPSEMVSEDLAMLCPHGMHGYFEHNGLKVFVKVDELGFHLSTGDQSTWFNYESFGVEELRGFSDGICKTFEHRDPDNRAALRALFYYVNKTLISKTLDENIIQPVRQASAFRFTMEDGGVIWAKAGKDGWTITVPLNDKPIPITDLSDIVLKQIDAALDLPINGGLPSAIFKEEIQFILRRRVFGQPKPKQDDVDLEHILSIRKLKPRKTDGGEESPQPRPLAPMGQIPLCQEKAKEERRTLLTEESAEVIKSLSKIDRFGEWNQYADEKHNLESEIGDFIAAMSLMVLAGDISLHTVLLDAAAKLEKFKKDNSLMSKQDPAFLDAAYVVVSKIDISSLPKRPPVTQGLELKKPAEKMLRYFDYGFDFRYENDRWEILFKPTEVSVNWRLSNNIGLDEEGSNGRWITVSELSNIQLVVVMKALATSEMVASHSLRTRISEEFELRRRDMQF